MVDKPAGTGNRATAEFTGNGRTTTKFPRSKILYEKHRLPAVGIVLALGFTSAFSVMTPFFSVAG